MTSVTTEHDENGSILLCMYVICRAKTSTALHCTVPCQVKSRGTSSFPHEAVCLLMNVTSL